MSSFVAFFSSEEDINLTIGGVIFKHKLGVSAEEEAGAIQTFCKGLQESQPQTCVTCSEPQTCVNTTEACVDTLEAILNLAELAGAPATNTAVDPLTAQPGDGEEENMEQSAAANEEPKSNLGDDGNPAAVAGSATGDSADDAGADKAVDDADDDLQLTFEVVVNGDGTRAKFTHAVGGIAEEEVEAFCSAHVGQEDGETCRLNLTTALEEVS
jgi:hypothetical protein